MTLCLAVNYGGRTEIADAARRLAEDVRAGTLDPDEVDEARFASYLDDGRDARPRPPDPDRRRAAGQQLPALADLLRRALGDRRPLARLPRRRPAGRLPGLRRAASASSAACPARLVAAGSSDRGDPSSIVARPTVRLLPRPPTPPTTRLADPHARHPAGDRLLDGRGIRRWCSASTSGWRPGSRSGSSLALVVLGASALELVGLLDATSARPSGNTVFGGVMALVVANWAPHVDRRDAGRPSAGGRRARTTRRPRSTRWPGRSGRSWRS